jgi:ribosomal protein S18 acetylase RimI-like enzyme
MHFRRLVAEDVIAYRALRLEALLDSPSSFGSAYEDEEPRTLTEWATFLADSEERVFFGALGDEGLVASVGIERESGRKERHRAFVRGMYVQQSHRGSGLGRRLLTIAMSHAAGWVGLEQVTLAVTSSNEAAISLYRSEGFTEYGVAPRVLLVGSTYYDETLLVRHLRAA